MKNISEKVKTSADNKQENFDFNAVLKMTPDELVGFFVKLDETQELDSFLDVALENKAILAQISYWEKWLKSKHRKLVEKIIEAKKEIYPENLETIPLDLEKKYPIEILSKILSNIGAIQLTFGCSKGCALCGFDAIYGPKGHIPYSQLANLFQKYGTFLGITKPFLYWASEPSDYSSSLGLEEKAYKDVHQLAIEYAGYDPHITSKNTNEDWVRFVANLDTQGFKNRISAYGLKEKDEYELYEITDKKIEVIGTGEEHKKGIGVSLMESKNDEPKERDKKGIGCFNGVLITPRGIYNVVQVDISTKFPQGQIICPIENIEDFKINVGDSIEQVLGHSIVKYHSTGSGWALSFGLSTKSNYYDIECDDDGVITRITDITDYSRTKIENELIQSGDKSVSFLTEFYPSSTALRCFGNKNRKEYFLEEAETENGLIFITCESQEAINFFESNPSSIRLEDLINGCPNCTARALNTFGDLRIII